ncbi:hypothetical protein D3C78_1670490 [compost metagenome]
MMLLGPAVQRDQRHIQGPAQFAQTVAHMRRHGAQILAQHQAVAFQFPERLRHDLLRNPVQPAQQLIVAQGAMLERRQDQRHPFAGNQLQGAARGTRGVEYVASRRECGRLFHGYQKVRTCP